MMKGKRFSAEQIMRMLHAAETMGTVREVCRQHNIAEPTLYRWRRQLGGMEVSDAKRLRTLERENAALQRLVGALTLANRMLQDVLGKNWEAWRPSATRQRLWSSRTPSARDAPAASWRSSAAQNGGRQAHGTRARCSSAFLRSRSALRALGSGSLTTCERLHSGECIASPYAASANTRGCQSSSQRVNGAPGAQARPRPPVRRIPSMSGAMTWSMPRRPMDDG